MPGHIQTSLNTLVPILKARIASVTDLPTERVLIVGRPLESIPHNQASTDVLVRIGAPTPSVAGNSGPGRLWTTCDRIIQVQPRAEFGADLYDRDEDKLLDTSLGIFALEEQILDGLQDFMPEDGKGNALVAEPLKWVPSEQLPQRDRQDAAWVTSSLFFLLRYAPIMTSRENL